MGKICFHSKNGFEPCEGLEKAVTLANTMWISEMTEDMSMVYKDICDSVETCPFCKASIIKPSDAVMTIARYDEIAKHAHNWVVAYGDIEEITFGDLRHYWSQSRYSSTEELNFYKRIMLDIILEFIYYKEVKLSITRIPESVLDDLIHKHIDLRLLKDTIGKEHDNRKL